MTYDKDLIEAKRFKLCSSMDVDEYFALYDKLLPKNLDSSKKFLLHRIDNLGVIMKIIERNPHAKYYVYGNPSMNVALKCLDMPEIVGYKDLGWICNDKNANDADGFDWVAWHRHPSSQKPTRIQTTLGIPIGEKLDFQFYTRWNRDCEVVDNDHVMFQGQPRTVSYVSYATSREYNASVPDKDKRVFVDPLWHAFYKGQRLRVLRRQYNNSLLVTHA